MKVKINNIISVDLGGTKILTAHLDEKRKIINRYKLATNITKGNDTIVKDIAGSVNAILKNSHLKERDVTAISLGVPGTVNPHTGIIGVAPNLDIKNFNIKKALQKYFSIPVLIENDVNLGALGIQLFEFNNKVDNMLVVFIGTGIGGALIFDGKLYRGSSFYAGEIGHMLVDSSGAFGTKNSSVSFEKIASRSAVVEAIGKDVKNGKSSILSSLYENGKKVKSKSLAKAVNKEDKVAVFHLNNSAQVIGKVLGSLATLLNFDTIVLGGGVIEAIGDFMLPRIEKSFKDTVIKEPGEIVKIKTTKLGDDAALYGGVALAKEFLFQ